MDWIHFTGKFLLAFFFILDSTAATLIIPRPVPAVENVTSYSITLNWTLPINELADIYTIEVHNRGVREQVTRTSEMRIVIGGLKPGLLYSFLLTAHRGRLSSDVSVILQDTIPLPPENLTLDFFQELAVTLEGVVGAFRFTIKTHGVQAIWDGPKVGVCDCFLALISPNDGQVSMPNLDERDRSVRTSRTFVHLVPGQTYTITVQSTTCGNGYLGSLRSQPISQTIILPPVDPPPVTAEMTDDMSTFLSWKDGGVILGFYDNFEVTLVTETDDSVTIETPLDGRTRGRAVTGLSPCTTYGFEVFTLYRGVRSQNSKTVEVYTRPTPPTDLIVTNFDKTSISIRWRHSGNQETAGFQVSIEHLLSLMRPATVRSATISDLTPGTTYNITVTAQCLGNGRTDSIPIQMTQTTVPLPPAAIYGQCSMSLTIKGENKLSTHSTMELSWLSPTLGNWDGYVVEYSPFEFSSGVASPAPPIELDGRNHSLSVSVPVTGRILTVQIRSVRQHIMSAAITKEVSCEDGTGDAIRQCRATRLTYRITITRFNSTHFEIEVTNLPLKNVTVQLSVIPRQVFVTSQPKFYVRNPCETVIDSHLLHVFVYPECDPGLPCFPFTKRLCPTPKKIPEPIPSQGPQGPSEPLNPSPTEPPPNACCNGRLYHTETYQCCHGKLKKADETNMSCCYTRWYDRATQKCCGRVGAEGQVVLASSRCS